MRYETTPPTTVSTLTSVYKKLIAGGIPSELAGLLTRDLLSEILSNDGVVVVLDV